MKKKVKKLLFKIEDTISRQEESRGDLLDNEIIEKIQKLVKKFRKSSKPRR